MIILSKTLSFKLWSLNILIFNSLTNFQFILLLAARGRGRGGPGGPPGKPGGSGGNKWQQGGPSGGRGRGGI